MDEEDTDPGVVPTTEMADDKTPEIVGAAAKAVFLDFAAAQHEHTLRQDVIRTQVLGVMIDAGLALGWPMVAMQDLLRAVLARLGFNPTTIGPPAVPNNSAK